MGRKFPKYDPSASRTFLYIGEDESFLNTLSLNLGPEVPLYHFSTETHDLTEYESRTLKRGLMQRYNMVEKVRNDDTQVIGILIGSVVVDNYMQLINAIKYSCAKAGKKYYEVLIGKLNEPKLKNFQFVKSTMLLICICRSTSIFS